MYQIVNERDFFYIEEFQLINVKGIINRIRMPLFCNPYSNKRSKL